MDNNTCDNNQLIINEPPRFGLESRPKAGKDVNTRKLKEQIKIKQQVINEKARKEEEKRLKKQPVKEEKKQPVPTTATAKATLLHAKPSLVYGNDIDRAAFTPQSQDFDENEDANAEEIFSCKQTKNGFQDDVLLSFNPQERFEIQMAIEESIKDIVQSTAPVDKVVQEMEEDFVFCEEPSEQSVIHHKNSELNSTDIECWELVDESSSNLVNLITTPYFRLDREFPSLLPSNAHLYRINDTNPWNRSKMLIDAISQQS
ncbi:hypothetical protein SAMD00019534_027840 [Acytostelium subglobosum LB1]|uniref:hypothetical protein n=1 Tax=Acytostelium subglobosum LB1 TaxID=1410327 RepID=UPI000644D963|nr:hypothetical protein SAMD00019534_027840 [Acytostelium subglobosum LB1]GAM19609.1 hypothetical protein SAMD00019534_027840 [Acytostelium subglobosum LB1]|eukprot:XP_012756371.1 hypothetical protein SAMD00019534_027840 [Acytostelium subglobosum LB1]